MAKNIYQVYQTNPITSNQSQDLMYFGRSPYGLGDDTAMLFSDFANQFGAPYTPSALTKTDDSNVTLTLGGSPLSALLQPVSLTLGWTGELSAVRGGTGVNNGANTATFAGNLNFASSFTTSGNFAVTQTYTGPTNVTFPTSGTLATTSQLPTPSALTRTDDTNVTITLGGTPNTALLESVSLTMGWAGQLSVPRGGTANSSFTAYSVICGGTTSTGALQSVVGLGSAGEQLTSNGPGQLPTWQAGTVIAPAAMTKVDDANVTLTLGGSPSTSLLAATSLTLGWTGFLSPARGGTGVNNGTSTFTIGGNFQMTGAFTFNGTLTGNTSVTFPTSGTLATTTSASGHVTSGTINQLSWYAATGDTVSGLSTVNNAGLLTDGSGVPGWVAYTGTGAPVLGTSPTITTPRIAQIQDSSGNPILGMANGVGSADYLNIAAATTQPELQAVGSSTNISMLLRSKGTGNLIVSTQAPTAPLLIYSGTSSQHATFFNFANTSATRNVTFQDADGTLAYLSDITGSSVPTGAVFYFPVASIPAGYLACNGADVSRTTYSALFALIGTTYGAGDGSTTFNLPNLARRVVMGEGGSASGIIGNTVASVGGSETINILYTNLPTSIPASNGVITTQSVSSGASTNVPGGAASWTTGAAVATSIVQPAMVLRPLIKT